jgi:hypothetical protein
MRDRHHGAIAATPRALHLSHASIDADAHDGGRGAIRFAPVVTTEEAA